MLEKTFGIRKPETIKEWRKLIGGLKPVCGDMFIIVSQPGFDEHDNSWLEDVMVGCRYQAECVRAVSDTMLEMIIEDQGLSKIDEGKLQSLIAKKSRPDMSGYFYLDIPESATLLVLRETRRKG